MKNILNSIVVLSVFLLSSIASAEVEVIVHPSNVASINKNVIQRIYLGKTRAFPDGKQAVPIRMASSNEADQYFTKTVLSKTPKQLKSYWAKMLFTGKGTPPRQIEDTAKVLDLIAKNPNLIGFVPAGSATGEVKVISKF